MVKARRVKKRWRRRGRLKAPARMWDLTEKKSKPSPSFRCTVKKGEWPSVPGLYL